MKKERNSNHYFIYGESHTVYANAEFHLFSLDVVSYISKQIGCKFYVDDATNRPMSNMLYSKTLDGKVTLRNPTKRLLDYLAIGNVYFENMKIILEFLSLMCYNQNSGSFREI